MQPKGKRYLLSRRRLLEKVMLDSEFFMNDKEGFASIVTSKEITKGETQWQN